MKDIQEIMKEMNYLDNQIAATIDEENESAVVDPAQSDPCNCNQGCFGTGGEMENCGDLTCGRNVPFSCGIFAPEGFFFAQQSLINPRIIFDVSCLRCLVEPCACTGAPNGTRFAVRIVGCIKFIINARIDRQPGSQCSNNDNVFLCCHDSVCVDQVVCFGCTEVAARVQCALIEADLANPCSVIVRNLTLTRLLGNTAVTVSGQFRLPGCRTIAGAASR